MLRRLWGLSLVTEPLNITKMLSNSLTSRFLKTAGESSSICSRCYSSDKKDGPPPPPTGQVFKHERHNMYVCWHPEVPFPYEMTKPIDINAPVTLSNLKIQALTPVKEAYRKKHEKLMIQELVKLTYATKHRFYGKYGKKKRTLLKQMDPNKERRNREYL